MKRSELRIPYPAHTGNWRATATPTLPKRQLLTFRQVMFGIILYATIISALVWCILAVIRSAGVIHG